MGIDKEGKIFRVHNDNQPGKLKASLTIEASIALPLMIFIIISLLFIIRGCMVHLDIQTATSQTMHSAAVRNTLNKSLGDVTIVSGYFKNSKYLKNGILYPNNKNSNLYDYSFIGKFDAFKNFLIDNKLILSNRTIAKIWNGEDEKAKEEQEYVFITPNGKVYHSSINCTYLKRSIKAVDKNEVTHIRNEGMAKYYPCEICLKRNYSISIVYVTSYGTAYHRLSNCSRLVRDIKRVPLSKVGGRGKCSKCYQ